MTGEELKEKAWKLINDHDTAATKSEEDEANEILGKIPDLIKDAQAKGLRAAGVLYLKKTEKKTDDQLRKGARGILASHKMSGSEVFTEIFKRSQQPDFSNIFGLSTPQNTDEQGLSGVARIVFRKCREANLNPYIGYEDSDTTKQCGIGICW